MKRFIEWAFYEQVPENLEMTAIYESYKVYCQLFGIKELTKFDFIQDFNKWER